MAMTDIVHIKDFDPLLVKIYTRYYKILKKLLPTAKIELVGSAAVPMKGKEEIDILIEVDNLEKSAKVLENNGFERGRTFLPRKAYFNDKKFGIECEFHIHPKGDENAIRIKKFKNKLKTDQKLRKKFELFKQSCEGLTRLEYRKRKTKWIKENIN